MNIKKLFLFLIISIFLINSVFAEVTENNYIKYGEIDNLGNLITTNTNINDVNFKSYYCSSSSCASVYGAWFGPLNTPTNFIQLIYPTTLYSSFGYGIYVYKTGYIPWEAQSDYAGNGQASDYINYLTKLQSCKSNINTLNLANDSLKIYVNANIKSPINHAGLLNYIPSEIASYYTVDVDVKLEVKKDGVLDNTKTQTQKVNIDFSGNKDVDFSFDYSGNGNYEIKIITSKGDEKCIDETLVEKTGSIIINNIILNIYYKDLDNDGYSDGTTQSASSKPSGYKLISELISIAIDCNDNNAGIHPGAVDICGNGIDEDCNGADAICPTCTNGATQICSTGLFGVCSAGTQTCVSNAWGSCVQNTLSSTEICNGIDDNCDGNIDEGGICGINDTFAPILNLLSPINNQVFDGISYLVDFIFSVNDISDISNCYVNVSGTNYQNITTIDKTNNNAISVNLSQGNYTAQLFCEDEYNNLGSSSLISFMIYDINDITKPASISNLHLINKGKTYLEWAWTNPSDADFAGTIVYVDNKTIYLPKSINSYKATGLTKDTEYTINVHTRDLIGHINNTDVKNTAKTTKDGNNNDDDEDEIEEEDSNINNNYVGNYTLDNLINLTKASSVKSNDSQFSIWWILLILLGLLILIIILVLIFR